MNISGRGFFKKTGSTYCPKNWINVLSKKTGSTYCPKYEPV
jgi:uncharacterized Zn finger protein (UPF0148 family)